MLALQQSILDKIANVDLTIALNAIISVTINFAMALGAAPVEQRRAAEAIAKHVKIGLLRRTRMT